MFSFGRSNWDEVYIPLFETHLAQDPGPSTLIHRNSAKRGRPMAPEALCLPIAPPCTRRCARRWPRTRGAPWSSDGSIRRTGSVGSDGSRADLVRATLRWCSAESRGSGQRLELGRLKSGHSHRPAMFQWQYRATSNAGLRLVAIYTNGEQGGHHETSHPKQSAHGGLCTPAKTGRREGRRWEMIIEWYSCGPSRARCFAQKGQLILSYCSIFVCKGCFTVSDCSNHIVAVIILSSKPRRPR